MSGSIFLPYPSIPAFFPLPSCLVLSRMILSRFLSFTLLLVHCFSLRFSFCPFPCCLVPFVSSHPIPSLSRSVLFCRASLHPSCSVSFLSFCFPSTRLFPLHRRPFPAHSHLHLDISPYISFVIHRKSFGFSGIPSHNIGLHLQSAFVWK